MPGNSVNFDGALRSLGDPTFLQRVALAARAHALEVCAETDGHWQVERRALAYQILRGQVPDSQIAAPVVADGVTVLGTADDGQIAARVAVVCDLLAGPYVPGPPHGAP